MNKMSKDNNILKIQITQTLRLMSNKGYKDCVRLFQFRSKGMDVNEIAEEWGITPNAVKQRLRRCRQIVKKMLEE
jgi:predicted DNA-binding protein YlxM (UPF0122 family)